MIKMRTFISLILSCLSLQALGIVFTPDNIQNPNVEDRRQYIADPALLADQNSKIKANDILWNLRKNTGIEVVIAIVPETGDYSIEDFSTALFTKWGIGKNDKDNGVLVVIATDQREARIATGYGVEGVIPDISARKIIQRSIVPYMKNGDIDGAITTVAQDLSTILSDPTVSEELKSGKRESWAEIPESDLTYEDILGIIGSIAFFIFLFAFGKYFYDSSKFKKQDRYRQALGWHNERALYILFAVLSLGLGLIPFLLAERKYRKSRNKPMQCSTCKGVMHKLNEEEDNKFLSASQDLEERLNTVDYDVWVCDRCGSIERYPYRTRQMKYEECPRCHTVAMCLVRDHTVVPSTTRHAGYGEKIYECKYCHHQTKRRYEIPRKADGTAAALGAGAILGSGRSGGFGGGFGGGSTGGGGATGRW